MLEWIPSSEIRVLCDNKTAVSAVNKKGSPSSLFVHKYIGKLLRIAKAKEITIIARYLKGRKNILADQL